MPSHSIGSLAQFLNIAAKQKDKKYNCSIENTGKNLDASPKAHPMTLLRNL